MDTCFEKINTQIKYNIKVLIFRLHEHFPVNKGMSDESLTNG